MVRPSAISDNWRQQKCSNGNCGKLYSSANSTSVVCSGMHCGFQWPLNRRAFPLSCVTFPSNFRMRVRWKQISDAIFSLGIPEMRSLQPLEIFRDPKSTDAGLQNSYSMLLRAVFQAPDRTLLLEELQGWAHRIFAALMELGAQPRFPLDLL